MRHCAQQYQDYEAKPDKPEVIFPKPTLLLRHPHVSLAHPRPLPLASCFRGRRSVAPGIQPQGVTLAVDDRHE